MQIGEFTGNFPEGAKIEVDGNALARLLNSFLSGQTHRVLEHWATRNLPGSEIEVLVGNLMEYTQNEAGEGPAKHYVPPATAISQNLPAHYAKEVLGKFMAGDVVEKNNGMFAVTGQGRIMVSKVILLGSNTKTGEVYIASNVPHVGVKIWKAEPSEFDDVRVCERRSDEEVTSLLKFVKESPETVPIDTGDRQYVPKKATQEMSQAAFEAAGSPSDWYGFDEMWEAALKVAPQPDVKIVGNIPDLDIAETYPKSFPSGFTEGEIVKRKDGKRFFLGGTKFVDDAVLVKSRPEHNLLFLGSTSDFSTTWTAPIELLNEVESTGQWIDENSLKHLMIAYDVLVGKENG